MVSFFKQHYIKPFTSVLISIFKQIPPDVYPKVKVLLFLMNVRLSKGQPWPGGKRTGL